MTIFEPRNWKLSRLALLRRIPALWDDEDGRGFVELDEQEYFQTLETSAAAGLVGGAVYDALLGQCALKAAAETLYASNTKDVLRLPAAIAGRVKTPDQARL